MTSNQIRNSFLEYFKSKNHTIVKSSSVIPENDPTLLFTNAGMNQFKNILLGKEKRDYTRAASVQKCIRAGGKHNDLESVGRDGRHLTFFEMLGNWSFGDYYKKEAIQFAWEYLTEIVKLDKNKLYVSVYTDDDESYNIWHKTIGLAKDRIFKFGDINKGDEENFWSMGDIGPCGPCSEIYYDQGANAVECSNPNCTVGCNCDRYIELWNNVFMEFNRTSTGKLNSLPMKSVDTGMGFERLTAILQNVNSAFLTDIFMPIIESIEKISGKKFNEETATPFRVICDHIRTLTFAIADGCLPSNEGRGYVLRRILRRVSRFGKLLDINHAFLFKLVDVVGIILGETYPEIIEKRDYIKEVIKSEEERFIMTLDNGIALFNKKVETILSEGKNIFPGKDAFILYDTFGFPLDLTKIMAEEKNLQVDINEYNIEMEKQQLRARISSTFKIDGIEESEWVEMKNFKSNEFIGYDNLAVKTSVVKFRKSDERVDLILEKTPFYAESGGQVSDTGKIRNENFEIEIFESEKVENYIINKGRLVKGDITKNNAVEVTALVDKERRFSIQRNHTVTHILQKCLRDILGDHIKQAGSYVGSDKMRFDFTHFTAVSKENLKLLEEKINSIIFRQLNVNWYNTKLQSALEEGVTALFGEKYGETVRVVKIMDSDKVFSAELCGGTHCTNTSEIGCFKILNESSVSAGIRRIEAITGIEAIKYFNNNLNLLNEISIILNCEPHNLLNKLKKIIQENEEQQKKMQELENKILIGINADDSLKIKEIKGVKFYTEFFENTDSKKLMQYSDKLLNKIKEGVLILGSNFEERIIYLVKVSKSITDKYQANRILNIINNVVSGSGGGKELIAQGGCKDKNKLLNFFNNIEKYI